MKFAHELTDEDKAEYVEMLYEGLDPGSAAQQLGSTGTAFRKHRSPKSQYYDPKFAAACEEALDSTSARKARIDKLSEFVWSAAEKGERWAVEKLLLVYHPDFEALRHQNLRITGQLDVVAKALPTLSTDELRRIREALAAEEQPAPVLQLERGGGCRVRNVEELEKVAGIERNRPPAPTRADVLRLTRKRLGPVWGRTKRKRRFG